MSEILIFFVFILGLCIGSFLNCVIYRLEVSESFVKGRSYCPHCKHTLTWLDLVPVASFLFLRGRCRYCHKKISVQYPIVEISTALIFLLMFLHLQAFPAGAFQFSIYQCINLLFLFYIASVLIVIFIYDLKHYLIPDKVLFPAIAITGLYRLLSFNSISPYLVAVVIASGFFLSLFLISKGTWMGFGDVKLSVLLGLLLGFPNILAGLFLSFLFGAIIGTGLILSNFKDTAGPAKGQKKMGLKSEIPFAPFLIIGTFIALLFGEQIIQWYFNVFSF